MSVQALAFAPVMLEEMRGRETRFDPYENMTASYRFFFAVYGKGPQ